MDIYNRFWHICLRLLDKDCRYILQSQAKTTNYLQLSIFNHNLRFLCKKVGLSQQRLADLLGLKRGKVAGYFYKTQAKSDFHQRLVDHFHIDLGKFLTMEMNDVNYEYFFRQELKPSEVKDPEAKYEKKIDAIDLLLKAKTEPNEVERNRMIDEVIGAYGKIISENVELKDKLMQSLNKKK